MPALRRDYDSANGIGIQKNRVRDSTVVHSSMPYYFGHPYRDSFSTAKEDRDGNIYGLSTVRSQAEISWRMVVL